MDFITRFFGHILSLIFDWVATITPVGSLGITIIIFTFVTRLLLTPLQISQQRSSRSMARVQPEMQKLQNKYKDKKDPQSQAAFSKEMQALYKKYKVNPAAGCLPMLIQLPIIWALFNVLRQPSLYINKLKDIYANMAAVIMKVPGYQDILNGFMDQVTKANPYKFDLAATEKVGKVLGLPDFLSHLTSMQWEDLIPKFTPDVQNSLNTAFNNKINYEYFLGINLVDSPQQLISSGTYLAILIPIIAGASTFIFSKITMASTMATQQKSTSGQAKKEPNATESTMKAMNIMMPIMTGFFAFSVSSGLALYWIAGNFIMMGQQYFVNKIVDKEQKELDIKFAKEREAEKAAEKATKTVVKKKVLKKVPVNKIQDGTKNNQ